MAFLPARSCPVAAWTCVGQVLGDDVAAPVAQRELSLEPASSAPCSWLLDQMPLGLGEVVEEERKRGQRPPRSEVQVLNGLLLVGAELAQMRELLDDRVVAAAAAWSTRSRCRSRSGTGPPAACSTSAARCRRRPAPWHSAGSAIETGCPTPSARRGKKCSPSASTSACWKPELPLQRVRDPRPAPVRRLVVVDVHLEQLVAQLPERELVLVVGQLQRRVERLVPFLQRERIVAVEVRVGGEQVQDLADAEARPRSSPAPRRSAACASGRACQVSAALRRVEPGEHGQRIEVVAQELDELRAVAGSGTRCGAWCWTRSRSWSTAQSHFWRRGPTHNARRCRRSAPVAPGAGGSRWSTSFSAKVSRSIWNAASWRMKSGLMVPSGEELQHVADVRELLERVTLPAGAAQLAPEADEDDQLESAARRPSRLRGRRSRDRPGSRARTSGTPPARGRRRSETRRTPTSTARRTRSR